MKASEGSEGIARLEHYLPWVDVFLNFNESVVEREGPHIKFTLCSLDFHLSFCLNLFIVATALAVKGQ